MDWRMKLHILKEHVALVPGFKMCLGWNTVGAPEEFLHALSIKYPFCPDALKELLRMSDGVCFNSDIICGSPRSRYRSIESLEITWSSLIPGLLPFGNTAGNGVFLCSKDEQIKLQYIGEQAGRVIAPSMDYFLGEVLMGKDYGRMYTKGFTEDDWTRFLRSQHWL